MMAKRCHFRGIRQRLSYYRVLLAIHWLSHDGLYCTATNAEISKASGRSPDTSQQYLVSMEFDREVAVFDQRNGLKQRTIVILDHPKAGDFIESLKMKNRVSRIDALEEDMRRQHDL